MQRITWRFVGGDVLRDDCFIARDECSCWCRECGSCCNKNNQTILFSPPVKCTLCESLWKSRSKKLVWRSSKDQEMGFIWFTSRWEGSGEQEVGKDSKTGTVRVRIDPRYYRPTEVELLVSCFYFFDCGNGVVGRSIESAETVELEEEGGLWCLSFDQNQLTCVEFGEGNGSRGHWVGEGRTWQLNVIINKQNWSQSFHCPLNYTTLNE